MFLKVSQEKRIGNFFLESQELLIELTLLRLIFGMFKRLNKQLQTVAVLWNRMQSRYVSMTVYHN
jgi:hypothetical protein